MVVYFNCLLDTLMTVSVLFLVVPLVSMQCVIVYTGTINDVKT